jgi:3-oxoadipate enol-lactonase
MSRTHVIKTLDGCALAATEYGNPENPLLLLSNSLGATQNMWAAQVEVFARHFRTITYDTRGHGLSDAPPGSYSLDRLGRDVLDLLDGLGVEKTHFCGISLGGMTGQWLAAHAPARFDHIVLAHTSAHMPPASAWQSRIDTVIESGVTAIAEAVIARWVTPEFRAKNPEAFGRLIAELSQINSTGYAGCCGAIRDMDLTPILGSIRSKCLIVAGSHDQATPLTHSEHLLKHITLAELVTTQGAHLSNLECVDDFNHHVVNFLARE